MNELNKVLPEDQEEGRNAAGMNGVAKQEPGLLNKVRQKFGFYSNISLVFGVGFALCFYNTGLGVNIICFSALIIILLLMIMKKLSVPIKRGTQLYYAGVLLLGVSGFLTSNEMLLFLNIIGILLLLDLSLLHQFYDDSHWGFDRHTGKMFGMFFYSIACIGMPFVDGINYLKRTKYLKNDVIRNILLGMIIAIPLLLIITAILSQADLVFGEITGKFFDFIFSADLFYIIIMVLFGFFACYCILCGTLYKHGEPEKKELAKADPTIAVTFMAALCLVYAFFCGIQIVYLFTDGLFALPLHYTFAEYARKGFFELLAVTIINIILMLLCNSLFRESKLLRLFVTCMTACTYIMIASAAYRMLLYIGAYQLTILRMFVLLALFIDAFVLAGVIIIQYRRKFPLFQYCVLVISVSYIAFTFVKPDYLIADYLVGHKELLTREDMNYLTRDLSLDAAPVVLDLISEKERFTLKSDGSLYNYETQESYENIVDDYYVRIANANVHNHIRDFNYSIHRAAKAVEMDAKKE